MKILRINNSDVGGAFQTCLRINQSLQNSDVDSKILVLHQSRQTPHTFNYFDTLSLDFFTKIKYSFTYRWDKWQKNKIQKSLNKGSEAFAFAHTIYALHTHPLVQQADVIHLHWVSNFIDFTDFFRHIQKPIVWTLHDLHPLLGGFHYEKDKDNHSNLAKYNQKVFETKMSVIAKAQHLTLAVASDWLLEQVKANQVLAQFPIHKIPNGIDTNLFKPQDKRKAKEQFNLPLDKKCILFVAENLANPRKGLQYILEAYESMQHLDVCLCLVGKFEQVFSENIICLGSIADEQTLVQIYSASDVLVSTALEESFGNTLIEAMACGVPTIGFGVGGVKDIIRNGFSGYLIEPRNTKDLAQQLDRLLADENLALAMGTNARNIAENEYDIRKQARSYLQIYQSQSIH